MPKYLSGRQKLRPSNKLTEDRYQYLGLDQAEPNLADPLTSPGVPGGTQYQLVAVAGYDGRRYWVPIGGSLQPGAITIFDEGTPVSSASSITQLNFVGAAVTARVGAQSPSGHPGIAATVTVIPVTVGENPPNTPTPNNGELWWESDTGDLYVYYNDGDSSQWVMANSGGRGLTGDKGEQGQKGEVGQKGEIGSTGDEGEKGSKGEPSTVKGDKGDKGDAIKGDKGDAIKGDKGDAIKGDKGEMNVIDSNADDRVITGSDTVGELKAESKLTFDSDNVTAILNVTGNTNISGITTINSNLDVDGDLDVDRHTNLDNVSIAGVATVSGNLFVGGVLTYEDVTNVDSVGLITAREGIFIPDNKKLRFGGTADTPDISIIHNTSVTPHASQITNRVDSQLEVIADMLELRSGTSDKAYLTANVGSATTIFHHNTRRFETTTDGVKIYGGLQDKDGDLGTSGQVLTSTGTQLNWVNSSSIGTDTNTTYDLSVPSSTTKIRLAGSDSTNDDVTILGSGEETKKQLSPWGVKVTGLPSPPAISPHFSSLSLAAFEDHCLHILLHPLVCGSLIEPVCIHPFPLRPCRIRLDACCIEVIFQLVDAFVHHGLNGPVLVDSDPSADTIASLFHDTQLRFLDVWQGDAWRLGLEVLRLDILWHRRLGLTQ